MSDPRAFLVEIEADMLDRAEDLAALIPPDEFEAFMLEQAAEDARCEARAEVAASMCRTIGETMVELDEVFRAS